MLNDILAIFGQNFKTVDTIETLVDGVVVKNYIYKYYDGEKLLKVEYRDSDNKVHREEDLPAVISYIPINPKSKYQEGHHKIWTKHGKIYRDNDKPSIITYYDNSDIVESEGWKNNDILHRDNDEPTIITYYKNGNLKAKIWYQNDKKHRDNDEPAIIVYYKNGNLKAKIWYQNDKAQRNPSSPGENIKPSKIEYYKTGNIKSETWYINNIIKSEEGEPDNITYNEDGTVDKYYKDGKEFEYPKQKLMDDIIGNIKTYKFESLEKINKILELIK